MHQQTNLTAPKLGASEELPLLIPPAMLADILGVTAETVRENIRRGELPGVKVCGRVYIKRDALIELMEGGGAWTK